MVPWWRSSRAESIPFKFENWDEGERRGWLIKCSAYRQEDENLIPEETRNKAEWAGVLVIPQLGRWKYIDSWCSLVSLTDRIRELQVSERTCPQKETSRWTIPGEWYWRLSSGHHTPVYTHTRIPTIIPQTREFIRIITNKHTLACMHTHNARCSSKCNFQEDLLWPISLSWVPHLYPSLKSVWLATQIWLFLMYRGEFLV